MKIYLASRFGRRDELNVKRLELEGLGHTVTSRWLTQHQKVDLSLHPYTEDERIMFAQHDFADVQRADWLIAFTEDPAENAPGGRRGGRHVELGLSLAWGKRTFVVGYRENVFCHLPPIIFCSTWAECLEYMRRQK